MFKHWENPDYNDVNVCVSVCPPGVHRHQSQDLSGYYSLPPGGVSQITPSMSWWVKLAPFLNQTGNTYLCNLHQSDKGMSFRCSHQSSDTAQTFSLSLLGIHTICCTCASVLWGIHTLDISLMDEEIVKMQEIVIEKSPHLAAADLRCKVVVCVLSIFASLFQTVVFYSELGNSGTHDRDLQL